MMCEDCANRDIRTFTKFVHPETGVTIRKVYNSRIPEFPGFVPNAYQRIAELEKRIEKLEGVHSAP